MFLLIGAVANVIYALENTKILQSVMMIIQSEHSFFTSSDDEQLWNALRRVRNTEILTAVSMGEYILCVKSCVVFEVYVTHDSFIIKVTIYIIE